MSGILYEIFIEGFKKYGAEIVCSLLICVSIWLFPGLRDVLKKSMRDLFRKSQTEKNPESGILESVPEREDYPETEELSSDKPEGIRLPEWINERRKEFVNNYAFSLGLLLGVLMVINAIFIDAPNIFGVGVACFTLVVLIITIVVFNRVQSFMPDAERGNQHAQFSLGRIYQRKKAYQLSYVWYYLAGLCGHPKGYSEASKVKISPSEADAAKTEAMRMFSEINADRVTAFKYYLSQAWNGDSIAQYNLGYSYQNGEGTEQDIYSAYVWYSVASRSGDRKAQSRLEQLKGKLFPSQTAQADEEAAKKFNAINRRKTK